jgi:hypothetical protein
VHILHLKDNIIMRSTQNFGPEVFLFDHRRFSTYGSVVHNWKHDEAT